MLKYYYFNPKCPWCDIYTELSTERSVSAVHLTSRQSGWSLWCTNSTPTKFHSAISTYCPGWSVRYWCDACCFPVQIGPWREKVRASPASLCCGPWAIHIYPSLVVVQPKKTIPYITERLLMGRKESNQTNKSTRENPSSGVCEQHRRRPACALAQSDQLFCYSLFWKVSYVNLLQVQFQFSS